MRERFAAVVQLGFILGVSCIDSNKKLYVPSIRPGEDMSKPPLADETLALGACADGILFRHGDLAWICNVAFFVDEMEVEGDGYVWTG